MMTTYRTNCYGANGQYKSVIGLSDRINRLDAARKFVTLMELELFEEVPNESKLSYLAEQAATVLKGFM